MIDPESMSPAERDRLGTCPRCGGRIDPAATICGWCQRDTAPEERLHAAAPPKPRADLAALARNAGAVPKRWLLLPAMAAHLFALIWLHQWVAPQLADSVSHGRGEHVAVRHGRVEISAEEVAADFRAVPKAKLRGLVSLVLLALGALIALWRPFTGTLLGLGADLAWIAVATVAWPRALGVELRFMLLVTLVELMTLLAVMLLTADRVRLYLQLRQKVRGDPDATPDIVDY